MPSLRDATRWRSLRFALTAIDRALYMLGDGYWWDQSIQSPMLINSSKDECEETMLIVRPIIARSSVIILPVPSSDIK